MLAYRFLRVYPVWEPLQMNRNCPAPVSTHSIVTLDHPMIICEALASGIPLLGAPFEQRPPSKKGVLCRQTHNRSEDEIVCPVSARCFNVFNCLPLPWVLSPLLVGHSPCDSPHSQESTRGEGTHVHIMQFFGLATAQALNVRKSNRKIQTSVGWTKDTKVHQLFWYSDTCHLLKLLHSQRPINAEGLHFAGAGQKLASCTRIST